MDREVERMQRLLDVATQNWHDAAAVTLRAQSRRVGEQLAGLRARVDQVRRSGGLGPSPVVIPDEVPA